MAAEAMGEVRTRERAIVGVGKRAEGRGLRNANIQRGTGRKARRNGQRGRRGALGEWREKWERLAKWDAAWRLSFKVKSKAAPTFPGPLSVKVLSRLF